METKEFKVYEKDIKSAFKLIFKQLKRPDTDFREILYAFEIAEARTKKFI